MNTPLQFHPYLRPMVWGGRRLGTLLGKPLAAAGTHGESWEISDHASHHSVVSAGPQQGKTLRQLMQQHRRDLLGAAAARHTTFPWLVKLLDACDWLSVQVHPPADRVGRLWPGENSKTEAWFVLDAAPGSRIYAGLLPGTDAGRLRAALREGRVAECLHTFTPRPGDCVFLPAGTVHAVGGGVVMAEVQQTSDATFRFYDWDRVGTDGKPRQLHVEQAMACIDWDSGPVEPIRASGYPQPGGRIYLNPVHQELVSCSYFTLHYLRDVQPVVLGGSGQMQVVMVLHGRGRLDAEDPIALAPGVTLLLPASCPALECRPDGPLGLLLSTLPEGG
jgi:mannose-6-phosphate isomerase